MSVDQFLKLYKIIMEKYSWKAMLDHFDKPIHGRKPKYIRFSIDTRDGQIWSISFQRSQTEDISFRLNNEEEIQRMFAWLDGEEPDTE